MVLQALEKNLGFKKNFKTSEIKIVGFLLCCAIYNPNKI